VWRGKYYDKLHELDYSMDGLIGCFKLNKSKLFCA